jgi:hypothetical protein
MKHKKYMLLILTGLWFWVPVQISAQPDEEAILTSVQTFFDGLAEADSVKLASVLLPDGVFVSMREDGSEWTMRTETITAFLDSISDWDNRLYERMWDPQVLIHDRIAVVWAPYDFYINEVFSHCGRDAFNLVKTGTGWQIAGAVYTVERTGCEESPFGPPRFDK